MLKNFITPAWQNKDANTRLKAIQGLSPQDKSQRAALLSLSCDDTEQTVQRAAMSRLADVAQLYAFSTDLSKPQTAAIAESVLSTLLGDKNSVSLESSRGLVVKHPELKESIIKFSSFAELRSDYLESFSLDEQTELIAHIAFTDTRQEIAERLQSTELLERARLLLKGKDKSAERIIRTKLDLLHAQERAAQEQFAAASEICEKMEFLGGHLDHVDFYSKVSVWKQRWDALSFEPVDELQLRYSKACEFTDAAIAQDTLVETSREQQRQLAEDLERYCAELSKQSLGQLDRIKHEILNKHDGAVINWATLVKHVSPQASLSARIANTKAAISSLARFLANDFSGSDQTTIRRLSNAIDGLSWPNYLPDLVAKASAQARLDELRGQLAETKLSETQKLDKLHKRINRLLGTSKRGDLVKAKGELAAINKAAESFRAKDKNGLDERLHQARDLLGKMTDWKDFATEPKYIELCEAMENLIDSKKHADKLSLEISTLQTKWKELGHSDAADKHWQRFKTASDAAYKPCADFFEKRHAKRKNNLQLREPLVEKMRALLQTTDWAAQPDYKKIEHELKNIHQAWQKIKDVERGPGQKQWNRISEFRAGVYAELDLVYDANIASKQELVVQAQAMLETDLKNDPIAKLKHLQSKWKEIGLTRRKQDQETWAAFKNATDAVFTQIQNLRGERRAEEDAHVQEHRNISNAIQQLAKNADSLAEADHQFEELSKQYQALPLFPKGLPEKLIERTQADFQRAENNFAKARERLLKEQKQGAFDLLLEKAKLCAELENLNTQTDADKRQSLLEQLAQIEITNKDHRQRIEKRIETAGEKDRSLASTTRRKLCIDLEILLGVDSPAEDSSLRMQTQLERMKSKGLGQGTTPLADKLKQMRVDWLCLAGAEPSLQSSLDKRFWALLKVKT